MTRSRRNRRKSPKRELPRLPSIPRPRINWRAVFAAAAVSVLVAASLALAREYVDVPVRWVHIEGSFQRVTKLEIVAAAQPGLERSFLTLDLDDIRRRVAAIDWVDTVSLQRVWPDTLKISYTEHRAAASWEAGGLLNTSGELFAQDVRHEYLGLPQLAGPEGSHRRVAARYLDVRDRLSQANLLLESIRMDARGSFSIELKNGVSVRLGRDDIDERIDRFFGGAVRLLERDLDQVAYIDMRYPNGFAVGPRERAPSGPSLVRLSNID